MFETTNTIRQRGIRSTLLFSIVLDQRKNQKSKQKAKNIKRIKVMELIKMKINKQKREADGSKQNGD